MPSQPSPITLRLDYVFHYASLIIFLCWTSLVINALFFELIDSDPIRGDVNDIPLVSDSTRHPTQHPFAAASSCLALYQIWFSDFILLVVAFGRDAEQKRNAWTHFAFVTLSSLFLGLSMCVFIDTRVHHAFASLGLFFVILWMGWLSLRPPFPEKAFVVRGCWITTVIAILAVICGVIGFFTDIRHMVALGEYIVFSSVSVILSLIAIGSSGTHVILHINTAFQDANVKEDESVPEDSKESDVESLA